MWAVVRRVTVITAVTVGLMACGGEDDKDAVGNTVRQFIDALHKRDASGVYERFSRTCLEDLDEDAFSAVFAARFGTSPHSDSDGSTIGGVEVTIPGNTGDSNVAEAVIVGADIRDRTSISLKREDGDWKVAECLLVGYLPKSEAEASVLSFFDSINEKDGGKAYDNLSESCLGGLPRNEFVEAFNVGLAVLGDAKIVIDNVEVSENGDSATAKVTGKIEGGALDGTSQDDADLPLKKEDGKWKIADCSFAGLGGSGS